MANSCPPCGSRLNESFLRNSCLPESGLEPENEIQGLFAALALISALTLAPVSAPLQADEITWLHSFDQALEQAEGAGKPLLVDFWAEWCMPCRAMDDQLWSREDVTELSGDFVFLRIDIEADSATPRKYRLRSIPTMLLADAHGTELARTEGFGEPDPYVELIEIVHTAYPELARWTEHLLSNPKHTVALRQIGRTFFEHGLYAVSNDFYQRAFKSPGAKENKAVRIDILAAIGWNELHLAEIVANPEDAFSAYGKAIRTFNRSLRMDASFERRDVALFGLVISHARRGERRKAAQCLGDLETEFAGSPATAQARKILRQPAP